MQREPAAALVVARRIRLDVPDRLGRRLVMVLGFDRNRPAAVEIDRHARRRLHRGRRVGDTLGLGGSKLGGRRIHRLGRYLVIGHRHVGDREFVGDRSGRFGELRRGRDRLGGRREAFGAARLGAPDRAAAHATHLAAVGLLACRLDVVGDSAGRADDQHRQISSPTVLGRT